eukprot:TRINITY_DN385_c2_g1_i1.p1 TRINITY_DN385_c2_g1~~TRINITY_DN385_c2_g1_i1.p1  ORF type:complete len:384 (+),score=49.11 TRINITY_DN385_c2_g1_i1:92-1243(+)
MTSLMSSLLTSACLFGSETGEESLSCTSLGSSLILNTRQRFLRPSRRHSTRSCQKGSESGQPSQFWSANRTSAEPLYSNLSSHFGSEERASFRSVGRSNYRRSVSVRTFSAAPDAAAADDSSPAAPAKDWPLPRSVEESVSQARAACKRAIADGKLRLQLELLLPLIGATDLDDWPGGIQQQFKAASPLVSSLLNSVVGADEGLEGRGNAQPDGGCKKSVVDSGDAVVAWESEKVALLLFATGETLGKLASLAQVADRPLLLVNPQWQGGQVISDFGFGQRRKEAEALVASFTPTYALKRLRIQSRDVRLLQCYPGGWQIFLTEANGITSTCIARQPTLPSYRELEAILRAQDGAGQSPSWFQRLQTEFKFNQDSLNSGPPSS